MRVRKASTPSCCPDLGGGLPVRRSRHRPGPRWLPDLRGHRFPDLPPDHPVVVYEAARYPVCDPLILHTTLTALDVSMISSITTLYIPPLAQRKPDLEIAHRLGIPSDFIKRRFEMSDEEMERLGLE